MTSSLGTLKDSFGRKITYLRLSVTDRCNLRCFYCMPQAKFSWMPPETLLKYEEIIQIVRVLACLGVKKIRLTGGEPLVRKDIVSLIKKIAQIEGIEKVCLTTNGVFLKSVAKDLFNAGLRHINISLDTLNPERFLEITGMDQFFNVFNSIKTCVEMGFSPIKINFVMMKGKNDDELTNFAELTQKWPIEVRFIEFMPIGSSSKWGEEYFLSSDDAKIIIENVCGRLKPVKQLKDSGPAELFKLPNSIGKIGFISPLSHKFCSNCNRIRIRADGTLRLCLFSDMEIGLRNIVRNGISDYKLAKLFLEAISKKPATYLNDQKKERPYCKQQMSSIGG